MLFIFRYIYKIKRLSSELEYVFGLNKKKMFWDPLDFTWDQRIRGTIQKGIHVLFNSAKISGSEKNIFIYIEYICQIM